MAIRASLRRRGQEDEEPRRRFQRPSKPVHKRQEADVEEDSAGEDDEIPAEFDSKPEEVAPPVVRRVVVPPPTQPRLFHKEALKVRPEKIEVDTGDELPPPAEVIEEPKQPEVKSFQGLDDIVRPAAKAAVENVTILKLLERVISVQEDLAAILKHLAGADTAAAYTRHEYPVGNERIEIAPAAKPAEYKAEKKPASDKPEKSAELLEFEKEWKSLTFEQKVAKAKKAGVKWEKHANQARENINLTMAMKKHLGLSK